jgi:hypothetical protein
MEAWLQSSLIEVHWANISFPSLLCLPYHLMWRNRIDLGFNSNLTQWDCVASYHFIKQSTEADV